MGIALFAVLFRYKLHPWEQFARANTEIFNHQKLQHLKRKMHYKLYRLMADAG
jgi:hypothetical protein